MESKQCANRFELVSIALTSTCWPFVRYRHTKIGKNSARFRFLENLINYQSRVLLGETRSKQFSEYTTSVPRVLSIAKKINQWQQWSFAATLFFIFGRRPAADSTKNSIHSPPSPRPRTEIIVKNRDNSIYASDHNIIVSSCTI